jgi:hypothetical protein
MKLSISFEINGETRDQVEHALRGVITDLCELENNLLREMEEELDDDNYAVSGFFGTLTSIEYQLEI